MPQAIAMHRRWVAEGRHGSMQYLDRYHDVRADATLLLPGAASIIAAAFSYRQPVHSPLIADYALGRDYHTVLRQRLEPVASCIAGTFGGDTRICIDTAPLRERYWAAYAGLGIIGVNNHLIIPGLGSDFFLAFILTTAHLPIHPARKEANPCAPQCMQCMRCVKACPGRAISPDGSIDARRCLSYLTIEHRGPLPEGTVLHGTVYGCDICSRVCPMNHIEAPAEPLAEFLPSEAIMNISLPQIANLSPDDFSRLFSRSAIKRTKLCGLQRNAAALADSVTKQ